MTGQGHAIVKSDLGSIHVEVRTVNHRGFKCSVRVVDTLSPLESKIEGLARTLIHRGSAHLNITWRRPPGEDAPQINAEVVRNYVRQLSESVADGKFETTIDLATLVTLPGVIASGAESSVDDELVWGMTREAVELSIDNLNEMRAVEGQRMAETLLADCHAIAQHLGKIQQLAPTFSGCLSRSVAGQNRKTASSARPAGPKR